MEEQDKLIDQSALAKSISDKLPYEFTEYFLVKLLDPIKVKKEVVVLPKDSPKKDDNGVEAIEMDKNPKTEIVEENSNFRKGIVISIPRLYSNTDNNSKLFDVKEGSVVLFRETSGIQFDLLKNSKLIRMFDIIGVEK